MLRATLCLLAALASTAFAGACRSSSTSVTGPSSNKCAITLSGSGLSVPGGGGSGSLAVSTERECAWTATSEAAWISLPAATSGQGPGTVAFTVGPNPAASVRRGSIVVGGERAQVEQAAAACSFAVSPGSEDVDAAGGARTFAVNTLEGCSWEARASVPWLTIAAGATGSGPGSVTVSVSPNDGAPRSTSVTIAGQQVVVSQRGLSCSFTVSVSSSSFPGTGGSGTATVVAALPGCQWSASATEPWITVAAPAGGSGTGSIGFSVAPNTGGARSAVLTVAGQPFVISQAPAQSACRYDVSPASRTVPAAGGTGEFDVASSADCPWTASSNASWITVTSGPGGSGNGRVSFSAAANNGPERAGTLSVAGQTVTVTQAAAPCSFTVSPRTVDVGAGGGTASVTVTAASGCQWSATSGAPWVTIASGGTGSGSGTVSLTVAANAGSPRQATVTVAGQAVTIQQAGLSCSYELSPASLSIDAGGGSSTVTISAPAGCAWTAASQDGWLTITGPSSGTGSGSVTVSVAANTGGARTGTLTIAGRAFVVSQAGAAASCTFSLAPPGRSIGSAGGTVSTNVSAPAGCAWTATSHAAWLTITEGASGTGNGTVTMTVAPNEAPAAREATATIAGQTFTLTQSGGSCAFTLSPTSASIGSAAGGGTVSVTTASGCEWTAASNAAWLTVTAGASGSGSGQVTWQAAANASPQPRTGTLTIAGQTFTVTQAAAACSFGVTPTTQAAPPAGGTLTFTVSTAAGCSWAASSSQPWTQITAGAVGSGPGTVTVAVDANAGPARTGTLTIAGVIVSITQAQP